MNSQPYGSTCNCFNSKCNSFRIIDIPVLVKKGYYIVSGPCVSNTCMCVYFRYVWEHLDVGYVQGMCDLLAPLLVIIDEGILLKHNCTVFLLL